MKKRLVASIIIIMMSLTFVSAGFFDDLFNFFNRGPQKSATDSTDVAVVVGNALPTITTVTGLPATVSPASGGTANVVFTFTASDANGASDLDDTTAKATFTKAGEITRTANCVFQSTSGNTKTYQCTVGMLYYDGNGVWNVAVEVKDKAVPPATATNAVNSFTYNLLRDIAIQSCLGASCDPPPASIGFGNSVAPGATNVQSAKDTRVTNNGNFVGQLQVTAFDLKPPTGTDTIPAGNFKAAKSNVATICGAGGNTLIATSAVPITSTNLPKGVAGSNTEDLRYCLVTVPPSIASQSYSTSNPGSSKWIIGI